MKNFLKLFGIIAMVAVIMLSMSGCKNDGSLGSKGGGTLIVHNPSENERYVVIYFDNKDVSSGYIDGNSSKTVSSETNVIWKVRWTISSTYYSKAGLLTGGDTIVYNLGE